MSKKEMYYLIVYIISKYSQNNLKIYFGPDTYLNDSAKLGRGYRKEVFIFLVVY